MDGRMNVWIDGLEEVWGGLGKVDFKLELVFGSENAIFGYNPAWFSHGF